MTKLIMLEENIEETPTKVDTQEENTQKEEEYKFDVLEQEPMEIDQTPWLSRPPLDDISIENKPNLFLLMWA